MAPRLNLSHPEVRMHIVIEIFAAVILYRSIAFSRSRSAGARRLKYVGSMDTEDLGVAIR